MENIKAIAGILRKGGVMLYPTDTLWGIGCDACNADAVAKVFALKRRNPNKHLIVLVNNTQMLEQYVTHIPYPVLSAPTPPLSIIYPHGAGFAEGGCSASGSVAIRLTNHDFCTQIISELQRPIVSTSANISGEASPCYFEDVNREIKEAVDVVVSPTWEGQPTRKASGIMQIDLNGNITVLR
jgi:L-threonylcarbamoyladenylate synthase